MRRHGLRKAFARALCRGRGSSTASCKPAHSIASPFPLDITGSGIRAQNEKKTQRGQDRDAHVGFDADRRRGAEVIPAACTIYPEHRLLELLE